MGPQTDLEFEVYSTTVYGAGNLHEMMQAIGAILAISMGSLASRDLEWVVILSAHICMYAYIGFES